MSWCQTPSWKKKAVVFTTVTMSAYQDQLNAGVSKVWEKMSSLQHRIFQICQRVLHTGLLLWWHFHAHKHDAAQNETWLVALPVSHMASWLGLGQSNRSKFPDRLRQSEGLATRDYTSADQVRMEGIVIVILCTLHCNVFSSVNETWGNQTALTPSLIVSLVSFWCVIMCFWRRRGFGEWFAARVGYYAFKAILLLLASLKSPSFHM